MADQAHQAGVVHLVNFEFRYQPARQKMRDLLTSGAVGRPEHLAYTAFTAGSRVPSGPWGWLFDRSLGGGWDRPDRIARRRPDPVAPGRGHRRRCHLVDGDPRATGPSRSAGSLRRRGLLHRMGPPGVGCHRHSGLHLRGWSQHPGPDRRDRIRGRPGERR